MENNLDNNLYKGKYLILLINKKTNNVCYLKYNKDIENNLYKKTVLDNIQTTLDLTQAYYFNTEDEAKALGYKLKYHYRELLDIKFAIVQF